MMRLIKTVGIITTVALLILPSFFLYDSSVATDDRSIGEYESSEIIEEEYSKAQNTNIPVLILSENEGEEEIMSYLSFGTDKVLVSNSLSDASDYRVILIDDTWVQNNDKESVNSVVKSYVDAGTIIASIGSADIFTNPDSMLKCHIFSEEGDVNAMYYDRTNDRYTCYTSISDIKQKAVEMTYCWMYETLEQSSEGSIEPSVKSAISDPALGTEVLRSLQRDCGDYGRFSISTLYYKVEESNTSYDYYLTHYILKSEPNSDRDRFTGDMTIRSDNLSSNSILLMYSPTSSNGNPTNVSLSLGVGITGASLSVGWSYQTPSVTVHDRCSFIDNIFEIWHNVDENGPAGSDNYLVEPAKIVRVDCTSGPSSYSSDDKYSVQYFNMGYLFTHPIAIARDWYDVTDNVYLNL